MAWIGFRSLFLILFLSVVACAPNGRQHIPNLQNSGNSPSPTEPVTVGDPGGGEMHGSTEDQVKAAIADAYVLFATARFTQQSGIFQSLKELIYNPDHPYTGDEEEYPTIRLLDEIIAFGNHGEVIAKSKISYEMKDCKPEHANKAAAVSKLAVGATICFNIKVLKQKPPSNLHSEIVALIAHEYLHLLGKGEEEGEFVQNMIRTNWHRFAEAQLTIFISTQMRSLRDVINSLNNMTAFAQKGKTAEAIGEFKLARALLENFHFSMAFIASGPSFKFGNREALIRYENVFHELFLTLITETHTKSEVDLPMMVKNGAEVFCKAVKHYLALGEIFKAEADKGTRYQYYYNWQSDYVNINGDELVISCPDISKGKILTTREIYSSKPTGQQSESSRR